MQQSRWLNWMIEQSSLRNAESLIRFGAEKLSSISNVPRLEAEVLLSNLLKINPIKFHTDDIGISSNVMDKFESMIESRFKGMPIAYLIGKKEFWSLEFEINPSVLVPRPETELLIENAIELLKDHDSPRILELDIALYSENNGTSDLEFIIQNSSIFLKHGGCLMLEHGYDQADYCMREMKKAGYSRIKKSKDIQNIPRTISGTFLNE